MKSIQNHSITRRRLAFAAFAGAALNLLFWTYYALNPVGSETGGSSISQAFESAFPPADAALGIIMLLAGLGLLQDKPFGLFCLQIAASMALYLGILDISFYSGQGLYSANSPDMLLIVLINAACLVGGLSGLFFCWKLRLSNSHQPVLKISNVLAYFVCKLYWRGRSC
jgi:hypothetical protein